MRTLIPSTLLALILLSPTGANAAPADTAAAPPATKPASAAAEAPPAPRPPWHACSVDDQIKVLTGTLELTPAQVPQVKLLLTQAEEQRKRGFEDFKAKMKALLTPEQQAKMEQMRQRFSKHEQGGEAPSVPRHGSPDLGLTPDQTIKMKMLRNQHMHAMKANLENHMARMATVLTPLQMAAYEKTVEKMEHGFRSMMMHHRDGRSGHGSPHGDGATPPHRDPGGAPPEGPPPPNGFMPDAPLEDGSDS